MTLVVFAPDCIRSGLAVTFAVGLATCGTSGLCEPSFSLGSTHSVQLIETWTPGSAFTYDAEFAPAGLDSCAAIDGLSAGVVVDVTPNRSQSSAGDGGCGTTMGTVVPTTRVTYVGAAQRGANTRGTFFSAAFKGTIAGTGCAGDFVVGLARVGLGDASAAPVAGNKPALVLTRWFYPDAANAPGCSACADAFVVRKLPPGS